MIVTTYQHDYIPPLSNTYGSVKRKESDKTAESQCIRGYKMEVPESIREQRNIEWTGIAPMGRLIYPRIIPTKFSNKQLDAMLKENQSYCHKEQQNRFLNVLPTSYPDLYDRLKEMPADELNRRLDSDRMFTTYQIDFCDVNEFPEGICKTLKLGDETDKTKSGKEINNLKKPPYNEMSNDSCEKCYAPFKTVFVDSSRFINSGNSSHWRSNIFVKKATFSEYMDTISKIGCAITKNNIHDHQKCNKRNCRHKLIHCCTNLK